MICENVQIISVLNFEKTELFSFLKSYISYNQLNDTYPARQLKLLKKLVLYLDII